MNLHVWTKYTLHLSKIYVNHIGGVMVSVLVKSRILSLAHANKKNNIEKCVLLHSTLTQQLMLLQYFIGCVNSITLCLYTDCCFSELALLKNPTKHVGLVQSGPHHHLIEN
jgi:hypothetical protein